MSLPDRPELLSDILNTEACAVITRNLIHQPSFHIRCDVIFRLATFPGRSRDFVQGPKIDRNTFRASHERQTSGADCKHVYVCVCLWSAVETESTSEASQSDLDRFRNFTLARYFMATLWGPLSQSVIKPDSQNAGFKG